MPEKLRGLAAIGDGASVIVHTYDYGEWDGGRLRLTTGGRDAVAVRARTMPDSGEMVPHLCCANATLAHAAVDASTVEAPPAKVQS